MFFQAGMANAGNLLSVWKRGWAEPSEQPLKDRMAPAQIILQDGEISPQCCHGFISASLRLGFWGRAMSSCLCSRFTACPKREVELSPWGQIHCQDNVSLQSMGMVQSKAEKQEFLFPRRRRKKSSFKILFKFVAFKASLLPWEF